MEREAMEFDVVVVGAGGFIQLIIGTVATLAAGSFAGTNPLALIIVCAIGGVLTPICLTLIPKKT